MTKELIDQILKDIGLESIETDPEADVPESCTSHPV